METESTTAPPRGAHPDPARDDAVERAITCVGNKVVARDQAVRHEIQPRIAAARAHLSALAASAGARLALAAPLEIAIPEAGVLRLTHARRPSVAFDSVRRTTIVELSFEYCGAKGLECQPGSSQGYFRLRDFLSRHRMAYQGGRSGNVGKVGIEPLLRARLRLTGDTEAGEIRIETTNVAGVGTALHRLAPRRLDADLLAALDRAVRNDPVPLHRLLGPPVAGRG